jgi:hypothetical protein
VPILPSQWPPPHTREHLSAFCSSQYSRHPFPRPFALCVLTPQHSTRDSDCGAGGSDHKDDVCMDRRSTESRRAAPSCVQQIPSPLPPSPRGPPACRLRVACACALGGSPTAKRQKHACKHDHGDDVACDWNATYGWKYRRWVYRPRYEVRCGHLRPLCSFPCTGGGSMPGDSAEVCCRRE